MEMVEHGRIDFLDRLEKKIIFQIILNLDLEDIYRLGRVSKKFREVNVMLIVRLATVYAVFSLRADNWQI